MAPPNGTDALAQLQEELPAIEAGLGRSAAAQVSVIILQTYTHSAAEDAPAANRFCLRESSHQTIKMSECQTKAGNQECLNVLNNY